jgi:hypothetical protein
VKLDQVRGRVRISAVLANPTAGLVRVAKAALYGHTQYSSGGDYWALARRCKLPKPVVYSWPASVESQSDSPRSQIGHLRRCRAEHQRLLRLPLGRFIDLLVKANLAAGQGSERQAVAIKDSIAR